MNIREKVIENFGLKVVSLLLAILLWLIANYGMEGNTAVTVTVPVQYRNLFPGLAIGKNAPKSVEFRITGPKILLWRAKTGFARVDLDMHGIGPGSVTFDHLEKYAIFDRRLLITRIYPSTIVVHVTKLGE